MITVFYTSKIYLMYYHYLMIVKLMCCALVVLLYFVSFIEIFEIRCVLIMTLFKNNYSQFSSAFDKPTIYLNSVIRSRGADSANRSCDITIKGRRSKQPHNCRQDTLCQSCSTYLTCLQWLESIALTT